MDKVKKLTGLSIVAVILLSLLAPMLVIQPASSSPELEYMTVSGVLATDAYSLYPYNTSKSLRIGFSKYGEMIDDTTNVGLEYGDVDPFAAPAGSDVGSIRKVMWVQGWLINITYYNVVRREQRNVWACALFSDGRAFGGSWIRVDFPEDYNVTYGLEDPRDPGYIIGNYAAGPYNYGGRKTNGTAVTEPIKVLYNGPRLFVALLNTTIYDHPDYRSDTTANDIPLVRILITIIFNKVKKEVILLKDVKSLLTEKTGTQMKIQFSNRGEVDLGTEDARYHSYFHFYTQGGSSEGKSTVYNANWTICRTENPSSLSAAGPFPQTTTQATYDVAQAINPAAGYVWWAAFWPSLSDWTIDGWDISWKSMMAADDHWIDGNLNAGGEPKIPFYIGEWDFYLWAKEYYARGRPIEFRAVTVYGVTDLNDGDDINIGSEHENRIDSEAKYQLNEIFNPWDLYSAVHKNTWRFVIIDSKTVAATTKLNYCVGFNAIISKEADIKKAGYPNGASWYDYCNATERVIVDGVLLPPKKIGTAPYYNATKGTDNKWYINVTIPAGTHTIKILWSNVTTYGRYEWIVVGRDAATVDSAGAALISEAFDSLKDIKVGIAGADMKEKELANAMPWVMRKFGTGNTKEDYYYGVMDKRTALKDDWCKKWPVASSNIIAVGGPLANLVAYYFNDFTSAFFGLPEFAVGSIWSNKIAALTCWNRNSYSSGDNTRYGYAVIATYKDINGTVGFLVWGHWGRDTYYASQWLWGDAERKISPGIIQLQAARQGATAIILKIDYTDPEHPTFSIVEVLGTISETKWVHGSEVKGGIHPDP